MGTHVPYTVYKGGTSMRKEVLAYMKYSQHLEIVYISTGNKMSKRQVRIHEVYEDTFRGYCYLRHAYRTFYYKNVLAVFPIHHPIKEVEFNE